MRFTPGLIPVVIVSLLCATELAAQRGQGRRRGERGEQPAQAPKPEPEAEKKAEKKGPPPKPIAYTNATVHVGDANVHSRGTVLIRGDKIEAVGPGVEIPKDAEVVDCAGKHICPGFIIVKDLGVGPRSVRDGEDYADAIDPFDPQIKKGLAAGITAYLTMSTTSGASPSGSSAVIKLVPESIEGTVVKSPAVHAMSVPLGPDGWKKFTEQVEKAKKYKQELADYEKKKVAGDRGAQAPKEDKALTGLLSVLDGKTRLLISSGGGGRGRGGMYMGGGGGGGMTVRVIREALRIAKLLETAVLLDSATEAWIVADEIAETGSSCILQPRARTEIDPTREDPHGWRIEGCAILAKAGVPITVLPPGGMFGSGLGTGGILGRDLNTPTLDPCFAVRGGMDEREALSTITLYPAMMIGVDDRIGSLTPGKDADLLILDGDPLHYKTFVETAIVNGKVAYEKDKEPFYRHIRPKN